MGRIYGSYEEARKQFEIDNSLKNIGRGWKMKDLVTVSTDESLTSLPPGKYVYSAYDSSTNFEVLHIPTDVDWEEIKDAIKSFRADFCDFMYDDFLNKHKKLRGTTVDLQVINNLRELYILASKKRMTQDEVDTIFKASDQMTNGEIWEAYHTMNQLFDHEEDDDLFSEFEKLLQSEYDSSGDAVRQKSVKEQQEHAANRVEQLKSNAPKVCCSEPNIVSNSAAGSVFYVCKNCKSEVSEKGFKI